MFLHSLKLWLAPPAWRLFGASLRLDPPGPTAGLLGQSVIYACLHRDILPAIRFVRAARPVLLVSTSPDGEILIRALGDGPYDFVRGETGPQGLRAVVGLRRYLEAGRSIGVAVDGPKGPFGLIQQGVLQLARLSGAAILPLVAEPEAALVLKTWDRTVVPRPFSRVGIRTGNPLLLSPDAGDAELTAARSRLADFFGIPEGRE